MFLNWTSFHSSTRLTLFPGAVPRTVRLRLHNVRLDTELFRVLRGIGGEQRGCRVSQTVERDHSRF